MAVVSKNCNEIRKVVSDISKCVCVPDFIYNQGRQKVLKHFLAMNQIYKTDYFFNKYESQARTNLNIELEKLL